MRMALKFLASRETFYWVMGARIHLHVWALVLAVPPVAMADPTTQHEAIPILLRRCVMCHGQDSQQGGLDLRTKAAMIEGGKSGAAFVSGKADESRMIHRIESRACPPDETISMAGIERVEAKELRTLRDWITAGAPVVKQKIEPVPLDPQAREHWSFKMPRRPEVPQVKTQQSVRNPLDAFLLRKLASNGLQYSAEVDRLTLLRRVTYDLTGLPPNSEDSLGREPHGV